MGSNLLLTSKTDPIRYVPIQLLPRADDRPDIYYYGRFEQKKKLRVPEEKGGGKI